MCPAYIAGLIGLGDRKSVQPMAARAAGVNYDQLHHFGLLLVFGHRVKLAVQSRHLPERI
jgi:hypothetical protein